MPGLMEANAGRTSGVANAGVHELHSTWELGCNPAICQRECQKKGRTRMTQSAAWYSLFSCAALGAAIAAVLPVPGMAAPLSRSLLSPGLALAAQCQCPCMKCGGASGFTCVSSLTAKNCLRQYSLAPAPHLSCQTTNCGNGD